MNKLFDREISEGVEKNKDFAHLIEQIDANPSILDRISYEKLIQVNAYYDEEHRMLAKRIAILKEVLDSLDGIDDEDFLGRFY